VTERTRSPVVAGAFYPADPDELAVLVDRLLREARPAEPAVRPRALIVPHAGYEYSGPVAASAYALLGGASISHVVLLGPAHFVPLGGATVSGTAAWATPLGHVPIDDDLRARAVDAGARMNDRAHELEHSLEVQLPFLQRALTAPFTVVPIVVGASEAAPIGDLIDALGGPDTLVVISTDLSHYHDAATARRLDRRTADAVLACDPGSIGPEDACGVFALRGIVELARRRSCQIRLLDLRNSADTAGDPGRVVGYGAFAVDA
jgi:hypothetical protein